MSFKICAWIVAYKDLGLAGQRDRYDYTLSHTAGILERIIVESLFRIRDTDLLHQRYRACARLYLGAVLML